MSKRVFVAGASGAIGQRLCPLLFADGWHVTGTTRSPEKVAGLRAMRVEPVIVDVFDEQALHAAVVAASPSIIVHQLTDLPDVLDPRLMDEASARNARMRDVGTRNLVAAARAVRATRLIAQSIAFAYAPGPTPYREDAPLNVNGAGRAGVSARGVASLEEQVLAAPLEGIVLRYGRLYGPGTGVDKPPPGGAVHVDAAADAAHRALTRGARGIYNVAESDGTVASDKAVRALGWSADFRSPVRA
jgi:nucleoside-diphosphate-sugar epimerase